MSNDEMTLKQIFVDSLRDAVTMYFVLPLAVWRLLEDTADDMRLKQPRLRHQVAELQAEVSALRAKLDELSERTN